MTADEQRKKYLLPPTKPGEKRNPNGRPKGSRNFSTIYKQLLKMMVTPKQAESDPVLKSFMEDPKMKNLTIKAAICIKDIQKALKGEDRAIERIQNRVDGLPIQTVDNINSTPMVIRHEPLAQADLEAMDNFETNIKKEG
jgi:hypothetical protein